jgi:hypothetical protein
MLVLRLGVAHVAHNVWCLSYDWLADNCCRISNLAHLSANANAPAYLTAAAVAVLRAARPSRHGPRHGRANGRPWHGRTGYGGAGHGWTPRTIRTRWVLLAAQDDAVVQAGALTYLV